MKLPNSALFLIPTFIWGSTWYIIKFQIGDTDPLFSVGYRFALAGIILLLYARIKHLNLRYSVRNHFFIALQGACLFGANYWLVYMATKHLTSGLVAVVFSGLIFMNVFFNALILKAPVQKSVIAGGMVGFIGIFLIFKEELKAFSFSDQDFLAFLMALAALTFASLGNILSAYNQKQKLPIIQTNAFGMIYGSLFVLSIAFLSGKDIGFDVTFSYISSLLYLSIFGSIIAFSSYLSLLGRIGPNKSGYITLVMPVIALIISTFLEGYQWTFYGVSGLVLILFGVFVALQKR